jgi:hypothetical protein
VTKQFDTLRARAALAGITLHAGKDHMGREVFVASRWAVSRTFDSLSEVAAWLDTVTGARKGTGDA